MIIILDLIYIMETIDTQIYNRGLKNYKLIKKYKSKGRKNHKPKSYDCSFCNVKYFNSLAKIEYLRLIVNEINKNNLNV
jgi:hypothetical protein